MKPDYSYWKRLDKWKLAEAILLLLEREPRHEESKDLYSVAEDRVNGHSSRFIEPRFLEPPLSSIIRSVCEYLQFAWASYHAHKLTIHGIGDFHSDPWVAPAKWLAWAQSKEIIIPLELQSATKQSNGWDGFDPEAETYPPELDIALLAWTYATKNLPTGKSPKPIIEDFLRKNYQPPLSNDAIKRIATICNWAKKGGAPRK